MSVHNMPTPLQLERTCWYVLSNQAVCARIRMGNQGFETVSMTLYLLGYMTVYASTVLVMLVRHKWRCLAYIEGGHWEHTFHWFYRHRRAYSLHNFCTREPCHTWGFHTSGRSNWDKSEGIRNSVEDRGFGCVYWPPGAVVGDLTPRERGMLGRCDHSFYIWSIW